MFRVLSFVVILGCCNSIASASPPAISESDWPWWRGQRRDGSSAPDQNPPLSWSQTENIVWKTAVPGKGHGSPTVFGDSVLLATADEKRQVQSVICFDREDGTVRWERIVHRGRFKAKGKKKANPKASAASSSVATDGERYFINFFNDEAIHTTALDLQGEILWQQRLCDYQIHQGYGASPAIYKDLVIASADSKAGGQIVAMKRDSGDVVWRHRRPAKPNYASPSILNIGGSDQLIFSGCDLVTSLDPLTGKVNWETEGSTTECVTTAVTDGKHVFTSGGYPKNHVAAFVADGSGELAWEVNTRAYVPSMLCVDGYLYLTLDAGVATCIECRSGEAVWKKRLGGVFSSSPVRVGNKIYATNEDGETFIFAASPEGFQRFGECKLGDNVFATPTICGGRVYTRVAFQEGDTRSEYLYCIGE